MKKTLADVVVFVVYMVGMFLMLYLWGQALS